MALTEKNNLFPSLCSSEKFLSNPRPNEGSKFPVKSSEAKSILSSPALNWTWGTTLISKPNLRRVLLVTSEEDTVSLLGSVPAEGLNTCLQSKRCDPKIFR